MWCAGGGEASGAHLPTDSTIKPSATLSPVPEDLPHCAGAATGTVMDYSRFSSRIFKNLFLLSVNEADGGIFFVRGYLNVF